MTRLKLLELVVGALALSRADAECADAVSAWVDSFGDSCGLYVTQAYCTDAGDWGLGWNPQ